jgi:hypothetical protein
LVFLALQAFITLLLTIIIVFIDRFTAIGYNHIFPPALRFMLFFFGLGWSNRVKLS